MNSLERTLLIVLFALLTASSAPAAEWGLRLGISLDEGDPMVGAEAVIPLGSRGFRFNPNIEQWFGSPDVFTVNGDFQYSFPAGGRRVWVGVGVAEIIPEGDLDFALNAMLGMTFPVRSLNTYVQVKAVGHEDFGRVIVGAGIRF